MNSWSHAVAVLVVVLVGGLIVGRLTEKPRIPDVAAYLLLGILLGPAVLNWISEPTGTEVNQFVLNVGATLILFEGGRAVRMAILRQVWLSIGLLATLGVLVSAFVVGLFAHFLLGTSWLVSLLVGSVIASTDPATLIPVFQRVPIEPRLQQTVESESAFNDATASVLVFTLIRLVTSGASLPWYQPVWSFVSSAVMGLVVGFVFGLAALWLVSKQGLGVFHEYGSIVMLTLALGAFTVADMVHASGMMAAFTAGVVAGNGSTFGWPLARQTEANIHHTGNAVTLIFRMLIFVLLGTQVDFHLVYRYLWVGLLLVAILMFVARPSSVLSSVLVDRRARWSAREVMFMFWVRETGVIPAALAGMMAASEVEGADIVGAITFLAILATILVQATTTPWVAQRLGLNVDAPVEEI
ncbi:cation:proton antiporter [Alicyclobacillus contaminans]|uniref:cation:proton antiporter n=1 Tax=Alicyclobacillus contaminans TaxID=392016 RepID=UPI00047A5F80|nr:cation:proton antiporter [Alicyclobacillus contaminans]